MRAVPVTVALTAVALVACERTTVKEPNAAQANLAAASSAPAATPASTGAPVQPPAGAIGTQTQAGVQPCRAGDLGVARIGTDAGAGQRVVAYALINNGRTPCALRGYPTVDLFDPDGRRLESVQVVQSEANTLNTGGPPQEVDVPPGGRAVFFLGFTGAQVTDKPCVAVSRLQVTPPGNTQALELQDTLQICTGQARLTPVRPDTGAASATHAERQSGAGPR